jgi:4-amino-4-deoxy-L-arabinose transferase-like glycosyltransferase
MDVGATRIRAALVVAVVTTRLVLAPAGRGLIATGGINGDDEAQYRLMGRDMLVRGVWFDLHARGWRTREKPPMLPLMIAAFARIRGSATEAPAQLTVGSAPILTVTATFLPAFGRADLLPPVLAEWTANIVFAGIGTVLLLKART